jgi:hypothetical protein
VLVRSRPENDHTSPDAVENADFYSNCKMKSKIPIFENIAKTMIFQKKQVYPSAREKTRFVMKGLFYETLTDGFLHGLWPTST